MSLSESAELMADASEDPRTAAIVEAAHDEFARNGYADANISAIAREAKVSTATIYKLVGDKDALFRKAIEKAAEGLEAWYAYDPAASEALDYLRELIRSYSAYMAQPLVRGLTRAYIAKLARNTNIDPEIGRSARMRVRNRFGEAIQRCIDAGLLEAGDLNTMAYFCNAVIQDGNLTHALLVGDMDVPELTPDRYADQTIEWMLKLFGTERGRGRLGAYNR